MAKQKFYVVWEGVTPGVYTSWTDCQLQIKGYEAAKYKSFDTREEAERALTMSPYAYIGKNAKAKSGGPKPSSDTLPSCVIDNSLAVDAACSGNPGPMEYRGVHIASRQEIFHFGPMKGTNNIGEFLAIVHGLALLKRKVSICPFTVTARMPSAGCDRRSARPNSPEPRKQKNSSC